MVFEGLKVIDAASFLAGPGATTVLADYGADVIKVEPLGGDGYRTLRGRYPIDYNWLLTSRNKRSLALDFSTDEGRATMHRLVTGADVFVTNMRSSQLDRFGLAYESLKVLNPRLIYGQTTGYGTEGPDAERRAFDSTGWWARTGMMDLVREQGQEPMMGVPGFGDHSTAIGLFGAIAMALYHRERTGEGSCVSTSLIANGAWANGMQLQAAIAGHDLAALRQEKGWLNPFTSVYGSADDRYILLTMVNVGREWPQLARGLGHEEWLADPRFASPKAIARHRRELIDAIGAATRALAFDELLARLDAADITYGRVDRLSDVIDDEHLWACGVLVDTGSDEPGWDRTINNPLRMSGQATRAPRRAPELGQHSDEILAEHGYDAAMIAALRAKGVVG